MSVVDVIHRRSMNELAVVSVVEWVMAISNEELLVVVEHSCLAIVLILIKKNRCLNAVDRFVLDSLVN